MCFDPITVAGMTITATDAVMAGAGLVSAIGSVQQGRAQESAANRQAAITEQQARREREIGELDARRREKENRALMARQRNIMGGSGIDISTGTALLLQADTARDAKFDENLIRAGAETRATRMRQQANETRRSGTSQRNSSYFRAGTTLLSTGGNIYARQGAVTVG